MAIGEALLTAEEYLQLPDNGRPSELVQGRIVYMNVPAPRHGQICGKVMLILGRFLEDHDIGHLISNDSGVVTERDPDTVRGADVAYYSYARVPKGPMPQGYLAVIPELVFAVRSPTDRWQEVLSKVVEYIKAGVAHVCILDSVPETAHLYHAEQPTEVIGPDDEFMIRELLGDFRVKVHRFFE